MFKTIVILLLAVPVYADPQSDIENQIFDQHKVEPRLLLLKEYERAQILALGETNHSQFRIFEHLISFLKKVGMDPRLKYIVLERSEDFAGFYEDLSVRSLEDVIKKNHFLNQTSQNSAICNSFSANPYLVSRFFPILRSVNQQRDQKLHLPPILVTSVDVSYSQILTAPRHSVDTVKEGDCKLPLGVPARIEESQDREMITAQGFKSRVWDHLDEKSKVIVVYHIGHLIQGFEACLPKLKEQSYWETSKSSLNWLSRFFSSFPTARERTRIVAFDEKEFYGSQAPEGMFQLSHRQANRQSGESFAIELAPFAYLPLEKGKDVFLKASVMRHYQGGTIQGDGALSSMMDGLIWSADAHEKFVLKSADMYLPGLCRH